MDARRRRDPRTDRSRKGARDNRDGTQADRPDRPRRRRRPHPGKRERERLKARQRIPHEFTDASRGIRIQKALAQAGVGSKRACEELIETGAVKVNGHVIQSLPAWVDPSKDHITINGRAIKPREAHVYVMFFKPRGVMSTNSDPEGRTRAIDLIDHPSRARLYPVGRLDMDSSGLLLLTNDGELANRLTHPRHGVPRTYELVLEGALDDDGVRRLESGVFGKDGGPDRNRSDRPSAASTLTLLRRDRDRTSVLMKIREGSHRRPIRALMTELGHTIKKLRRVAIGPLKLSGLQPGQWRELTGRELAMLCRAAGRDEKG